ncbi:MAG: hypothetical protein JWP12_1028 [Bacteroidetes bacterium]|nr:hypothetical protein [Bacteroidota bacterium]
MRNACNVSVLNMSGMKVELTLSWMSGSKDQKKKVTIPYTQNISLFELNDNTEVTVEGKIGNAPIVLMFNYKHNASLLSIEVFPDGSYSIN